MKSIILAILIAVSSSAFALNLGPEQIQGQDQGQLQTQGQAQGQAQFVNVSSRISNDSRAAAKSYAGSNSNSGSSSGGNTLSNGGNSLTVNEAPIPDHTYANIRNVPSVFAGNVYPTAPCMGSSTIGGAGVGFGFSIGSSWTDDECGIRETSRSFSGLGLKDDAVSVLCTSKYAAAAKICKKEVQPVKE